jgi:hypothetical protein
MAVAVMADGGWRMADGGWRMADGGWQSFSSPFREWRMVNECQLRKHQYKHLANSVIVFLRIRAVLASVKEATIQASIQRMADRGWWMAVIVFLGILAVLETVE